MVFGKPLLKVQASTSKHFQREHWCLSQPTSRTGVLTERLLLASVDEVTVVSIDQSNPKIT